MSNKLTQQTFKIGINKLKMGYLNKFSLEETNVKLMGFWYTMLMDYTCEVFLEGVTEHIKTIDFPPTIASLRRTMDKISVASTKRVVKSIDDMDKITLAEYNKNISEKNRKAVEAEQNIEEGKKKTEAMVENVLKNGSFIDLPEL